MEVNLTENLNWVYKDASKQKKKKKKNCKIWNSASYEQCWKSNFAFNLTHYVTSYMHHTGKKTKQKQKHTQKTKIYI